MSPYRMPRHERSLAQREERRRRLLEAAAAEAISIGSLNITRQAVAERAGVSLGTINHEFGVMASLRDALVHDAIARLDAALLASAIGSSHPLAKDAPDSLREAAKELI